MVLPLIDQGLGRGVGAIVLGISARRPFDAEYQRWFELLAGQIVDPKLVYFRTVPKFETAAPELQWLARSVFVGIGERFPTEVVVRFYRLE